MITYNLNNNGMFGGYMVSKVNCCAITGTEVLPICVETDVCSGLPSFDRQK